MTPTNRRLRLVLQSLAVLAVAVAVAVVIGWLAVMGLTAGADPNDSWAELGLVLVGIFLGVVAGLVAWVVGLVRLARRFFPRGERASVVMLAVLAVAVLGGVLMSTAGVLMSTGDAWVGSMGQELGGLFAWLVVLGELLPWLVVLAAPSVVFVLWDRRSAGLRAAEVSATWHVS